MSHEHRILKRKLIRGEISPHEFKTRIDILHDNKDNYDNLAQIRSHIFKQGVRHINE